MDWHRFDRITKLFTERRLSRRAALAVGGAGLVSTVNGRATAQEATPITEDVRGVPFMFVQTFGAGELAPKAGEEGMLTLTADHLAGQTVFFSDRPERIVGMVSTERFLGAAAADIPANAATPEGGIGFTPADPPNAALVFASTEGVDEPSDVLIVELIDPTYDPVTGKASDDVKVLAEDEAVGITFVSEPVEMADAIR